MAYDEALAGRVRGVLHGSTVQERRMFGGLAFLIAGRMCCGVQDSDLMVRVPPDMYAKALRRPHVRPMDFTGRPLKGFVYVNAEGTRTAAALRGWITIAQGVATAAAGLPARRPTRHGP